MILVKDRATYEDFKQFMKKGFTYSVLNPVNKMIYDYITWKYKPGDIYDLILKLQYYLNKKIKFITDNEFNQDINSPIALLKRGFGDCKSYTLFGSVMLFYYHNQAKNEANLVSYPRNPQDFTHIFNTIYYNQKPLYFDLTIKNVFSPSPFFENQIIVLI